MDRYQIWDKVSDVFTPSGHKFTAQQWREKYPWVDLPGAKMIITTGVINGGCAMEWGATVAHYKRAGAEITDSMTDDEVLAAIEDFEDNPPDPGPTVEERTAAALEFLAINSLPDTTPVVTTLTIEDQSTNTDTLFVYKNYKRNLWSLAMVKVAANKGVITSAQYKKITGENYK